VSPRQTFRPSRRQCDEYFYIRGLVLILESYYVAYKLSPMPIASVPTSTLYPLFGSLNNRACSARVSGGKSPYTRQHFAPVLARSIDDLIEYNSLRLNAINASPGLAVE
jgi:hypothetical protein